MLPSYSPHPNSVSPAKDRFSLMFDNRRWLLPLLVGVAAVTAYCNSFPGDFILDDIFIVQANPLVAHLDLSKIFRSDYWAMVENSGLYRPLTILSLGLNRLLLGEEVWGYHLVNVALHAAVAVLLLQTLRRWHVSQLAALVAALLFAVHPVHVDVVDTVVGRSELLVALFLLGAFWLARGRGRLSGFAVCLCYLGALLSKEHAITFLGLLPLVDRFLEGPDCWRRRYPLYAGLAGVAVVWLVWRQLGVMSSLPTFGPDKAGAPLAYVDPFTRVLTGLLFQGLYLCKLFIPLDLQAFYSIADLPPFISTLMSARGVLVVAASAGLVGAVVWGWRRHSFLAFFTVLYFVSFSPTANLFFPIGVSFAERLAYFPSIWFCAFSGYGIIHLFEKMRRIRPLIWVLGTGWLVWLGWGCLHRNLDYADSLRLWSAEVAENPKDFKGWQTLGETLNSLRRFDEAEKAFGVMLDLAPDYQTGLHSVTAFYSERDLYEMAFPSALKGYTLSEQANEPMNMAVDGLNLADVLLGMGQCGESLKMLDGPVLPLKEQTRTREIRGGALLCLGQEEEAVAVFSQIKDDLPGHRVRYLHGLALQRLGRLPEARQQLEKAVVLSGDGEAFNLLGVVCAQLGDWPAAISALEKAVAQAPGNLHYRDNLNRARRDAGAMGLGR